MNHIDDELTSALTALAGRADGDPASAGVNRVAAVRRRARHAAVVRASVVAGALGVVLAVTAGGRTGVLPFGRADGGGPAGRVRTQVPGLTVELRQDETMNAKLPNRQGASRAYVFVHIHGMVPRRSIEPQSPSGRENLLELMFARNGHKLHGSVEPDPPCTAGAPLVPVDDEFPDELDFTKAGTYEVEFWATACPPIGKVVTKITVTARD